MPTVISDGKRIARVDQLTQSLLTVDYPHHEGHEGNLYRASFADPVTADTAIDLTIRTPSNGEQCHMEAFVETANASLVWFYEDVEVTSNGTTVAPRNANRNSKNISSTEVVFTGGTIVTTNATILGHRHIGALGKRAQDAVGGSGASRHEWILRENTWYTLRVLDTSGSDQDIFMLLEWYEHTPKIDSDTN